MNVLYVCMCYSHWTAVQWYNNKSNAYKHYKSVPGERQGDCESVIEGKGYPVML